MRGFLIISSLFLVSISFGCSNFSQSVAASESYPVIVAFGDSLTAGLGIPGDENYPSKLQEKMMAYGYRYRVINAGISGETTQQALNRVGSICALRPKIVILEFGANDGFLGFPVSKTRRNLAAIISRLHSVNATVILAGMKLPPDYGRKYTQDFRNMFFETAKQNRAYLIPFFLEGVGHHPTLNQRDGLHPNAKGYDLVTEKVWKVLQPLLEEPVPERSN